MNFRNAICEHLAKYKRETLGVAGDGVFRYRGKEVKKPHILPDPDHNRKLNVLTPYREQFFSSEHYRQDKLHRYFHHLNSSQAMCINLFYPLIAENAAETITRYLGIDASDLRPCFEKESELETTDLRKTNFDFYIEHSGAQKIFFEVKYTEEGFGKAMADSEHKAKFRHCYLPLVRTSKFLRDRCQEEKCFLEHYQILRNLVHIESNSCVVFLFPSLNKNVHRQALEAKEKLLTDSGRSRFKIKFLEDTVSCLASCQNGALTSYYKNFRQKYLPAALFGGKTAS